MSENSLKKGRYTKYGNKIGLYSNSKGGFIKNDTDVVLNFPFKDAVLEAGMSKEDVGREERFLHIEIDSKDIDTLEEPKVLTDFRYIDKDGEKALDANSDIEFFDTEGNLKQNLLIKGNNLLALYTLRERLAGQVKLIYIDPPYNTGNDGFRYNDNFNHSAWLAFMKNRLEVAKDLLREDGMIFVSCDDNEQAYLKVLMDEVFSDGFIATIPVVSNLKGNQDQFAFAGTHEYLLVFAKDKSTATFYNLVIEDDSIDEWIEDEVGFYKQGANLKATGGNAPREKRRNLFYPVYISSNNELFFERQSESDFELLPITDGKEMSWRWQKETMQNQLNDVIVLKNSDGYSLYKKQRPGLGELPSKKPKSVFYKPEYSSGNGTNQMKALFSSKIFDFPKPEDLIKDIIQIGTKEGDLVLDFSLGSGTSSAVAHKMNRRWVGIEQMDYIEEVAKERLKKVVVGEQGGISKSVGWQGGGSFIYFELKKYNQEYVERIMVATSLSELEDVYVDMRNNAFLKFFFDRKEFEKDEDFRKADLDVRKQKLVDVLDENQLYLNYADMDDARHKVTADEKTLTDKFYGSAKN